MVKNIQELNLDSHPDSRVQSSSQSLRLKGQGFICHKNIDSIAVSVFIDCLRGLWLSIRRQGPNNYSDTLRRGALTTKIYRNFAILSQDILRGNLSFIKNGPISWLQTVACHLFKRKDGCFSLESFMSFRNVGNINKTRNIRE